LSDDFVGCSGCKQRRGDRGSVEVELDVGIVPGDGEAEAREVVLVVDERIGLDEGWIVDGDAVACGNDSSFVLAAAPAPVELADNRQEFLCCSDPSVEDGLQDV
jgi:hypothetical protein